MLQNRIDFTNAGGANLLKFLLKINLTVVLILSVVSAMAQTPSFPGAQGFGNKAVGGRGGRVIEVTNLNDSGPGSFRDALEADGPRIVVFRTGGEIKLQRPVNIKKPNITIAAQTAPGDGITISGREVVVNSSEVIIRGLKVRVGRAKWTSAPDGIAILAKRNKPIKNIILDHCTVSWSIDENFAVNGIFAAISNVTLSNNITSEGLYDPALHSGEPHSMGMLISKNSTKFSIIGNLFVHNDQRQPKFADYTTGEAINNVVYNWGQRATDIARGTKVNLIGNYYISGSNLTGIPKGIYARNEESPDGDVYVKDNIGPGREHGTGDEWNVVQGPQSWQSNGLIGSASSGAPALSATEALDFVLDNAGAIPRDAHDIRIIEDVRNGTGSLIQNENQVGGYLNLDRGTPPPDSDKDGMPDSWETSKGLNPNNAADGNQDRNGDGYTNIEEYINSFFLAGGQSNATPTISNIPDQTINQDEVLGPLDFTIGDDETSANDLTVTASSNRTSLVPNNAILLEGNNANRQITVTPNNGEFGEARITITVSDGNKQSSTSFKVIVQEVANEAPTISGISDQTMDQDAVLGPLDFTISDAETSNGQLTVTASSNQTNLVENSGISLGGSNGNRNITVAPVTGAFGETRITIVVSDGTSQASTSFIVTIEEVIPNAIPDISSVLDHTINQDSVLGALSFTVDDQETSADQLVVTASSSATGLISNSGLDLGGNGADRTITLTPRPGQFGQATITLTVSDGTDEATSAFEVTVQKVDSGVNTPPIISNFYDQTIELNTTLGPLSFTIADAESSPDSLVISASSDNNSLVADTAIIVGGTGATRDVTITPVTDEIGETVITITVSDGNDMATTSFVVTVEDIETNTPPEVSRIEDQTIDQDQVSGPLEFTISDLETAADELIVTASSNRPTLVPNGSIVLEGTGTNRQVTVTPLPDGFGHARITINVSDGIETSSTSFKLVVQEVINTPPTIGNIDDQAIDQDQTLGPLSFTIDDQETAADELTISAVSDNQSLIPDNVIQLGGANRNREITITPTAGQFGQANITLTVSDGISQIETTFNLVVNERINTTPTISRILDQVIAQDGVLGPITFFVNDAESPLEELVMTASTNRPPLVAESNIVLGGSGNERTITVTPVIGEFGHVRITLVVSDGELESLTSFKLTVKEKSVVNTAPTISDIPDQGMDQDDILGPVNFVVEDAETPENQLTVTATSSDNNILSDLGISVDGNGANRSLLISPEEGQFGEVVVTITVTDGTEQTSTSFNLIINQLAITNTPPVISGIPDQVMDQDQILGPIPFVVSDTETPPNALSVSATSNKPGLVNINGISLAGSGEDREIFVSPRPGQFGEVTITITVSDGSEQSSSSFSITVNEVENTAPSISVLPDQNIFVNQTLGPLGFAVKDAETPNTLAVSATSNNTDLLDTNGFSLSGTGVNREITIQPKDDQLGTATITIKVTDGKHTSSTSFELIVEQPAQSTSTTVASLSADFSIEELTCSGDNTGSISAIVQSGNPPYKYKWSNGVNARKIENLPAGSYSVTISDAEGLSIMKTAVLEEVPEIEIVPDMTLPRCQASNGSIGLTVSGGNGPFSYEWSNGSKEKNLIGLAAGDYSVKIIDQNKCSKSVSFNLPSETIELDNPTISQNSDTLTVNVDASSYRWFRNGELVSGAQSQTLVIEEADEYAVTITDENGCSSTSDSFVAEQPINPFADFDGNSVLRGLELYPNPASDEMFLKLMLTSDALVATKIYGIHGNLISEDKWGFIQRGESVKRIDVSSLKPGYYLIKVSTNNGIAFRRFYKK